MKVHLKYHDQPQGQLGAAFLRGSSLMDWLPEMERWGLSISLLRCYLVPTSLADRSPSGLLVVLPESHDLRPEELSVPCYFLGNKLILPLNAQLRPAISNAELDRKLLFQLQFLHPSLGMVGWEANEQWSVDRLLTFGPETLRNWTLAHPGNALAPPLHEVKVPQPSIEEALEGLKDGIDRRPLDELGDKDAKEDNSPWGRFKAGLLKGGLSMTRGIMGVLPEGSGSGGAGFDALSSLSDWLGSQVDGLGQQRSNALDKLMDLFDKDPEMALRYAIPLDNPYQKRGMGSAGGSLSEKNTNFDMGRIGGGLGGNTWNVASDRYQTLRERYLKAANEAIARGEFDKAAYIYAHLLHDLQGAANVLQQGKMYREAAVIYKDHIKQPLMAAECLEKGGLFLDAIDIYLDLQKWEKAGDLYTTIGKKVKADAQYERCVEAAMEKADYLEACRLLIDKMQRQDRALVTMLQGWQDDKQSEACLKRYLETLSQLPQVDMAHQIEMLYTQHTPILRQGSFLTILAGHFGQLQVGAPRDKARNIAYEILSSMALQGDNAHMHLLQKFVEGDSLIGHDVSRFNAGFKKDIRQPFTVPHLNKNIHWLGCKVIDSQVLAYGREGNHLWMARFNWQGHVEYYHWPETLEQDAQIDLIPQKGLYGMVYIITNGTTSFSKKTLPVNERFSTALEIGSPTWLGDDRRQVKGICARLGGDVSVLVAGPSYTTLKRYKSSGELLAEVHCKTEDGNLLVMDPESPFQIMHESHLDVIGVLSNFVISINSDGDVYGYGLNSPGNSLALCEEFDARKLCAVATTDGCQLIGLASSNALLQNLSKHPVVEVCFLPGKLLAMILANLPSQPESKWFQVHVYDVSGEQVTLEMQVDPEFEPVSIFAGPHRRSFCLLGRNGFVQAHEVEERMDNWI